MFNKPIFTKRRLGLFFIALVFFYFWHQIASAQFIGAKKQFKISRGDGFLKIAQNLKSDGIIKSRLGFFAVVFAKGSIGDLKAGEYIFEPDYNLIKIVEKIKKGEVVLGSDEMFLTIPEGLNLGEISDRIKLEAGPIDLKKIKASALVAKYSWLGAVNSKYNTLEGFLFPDTYRFNKEATNDEIISRILNNFEAKTAEFRTAEALRGRNFYNILIMASILEKEVPPQDMAAASGVLWKRLEIGMPLQVDASLVYALGRPISRSDTTSLDSFYNTYKYKDLPPAPISNPGLLAWRAASYPQKNDYLYYLTRSRDGATIFSKTLEEHNLAKAKYLGF